MIGTSAQDVFISSSVIGLLTTIRNDGSPSSSMVSFARRSDRLFFSTTVDRLKGRMLSRDRRCGLTVLNPKEPWSFVVVEAWS